MKYFSVLFFMILISFSSTSTFANNSTLPMRADATSLSNANPKSDWIVERSTYMTIRNQNGTLVGVYDHNSPPIDEWRSASASKSVQINDSLQFDVDFTFDFQEMGEIYLYGFDNNGTTPRWVAGYSDAWSAVNGVPLAQSWQSGSTLYSQSFPVNDPQRDTIRINYSSGSGHISVHYLGPTSINATVTLPGEFFSRILPVSGPIDTIKIMMSAAGAYNSPSDVWNVYNYKENGGLIPFTIISTVFSSTSPNSLPTLSSLETIITILGLLALVGVFGFLIIKKIQSRSENNQIFNPNKMFGETNTGAFYEKDGSNKNDVRGEMICFNCQQNSPSGDVFCQNCGTRLK